MSAGKGFEWRTLDEPAKRGLARAAKAAAKIVDAKWESTGETPNGWKYAFSTGRAGHDPALRAALCKYELGAQLSDQVTICSELKAVLAWQPLVRAADPS
jgi:hypothetical protein